MVLEVCSWKEIKGLKNRHLCVPFSRPSNSISDGPILTQTFNKTLWISLAATDTGISLTQMIQNLFLAEISPSSWFIGGAFLNCEQTKFSMATSEPDHGGQLLILPEVFNEQSVSGEWASQAFLQEIYLSMHWAARQAAVSSSLMWVSQLEASSLLSQRSMLCDWSLQASTSLMKLSCRILNLWEQENIVESVSRNIETRTWVI